MKLGVCTGPENIELAAKLGFDYVELGLGALADMPEEDYQKLLACKPDFPIPALKCNGFVLPSVRLTGPDASAEAIDAYLAKAMRRAHEMGVKVVVFGSGAARQVPEGFSFVEAWRQLADFLRRAAEYGDKYDIDIAIEPLRRQECNIMNMVSEATLMAALVDNPRVGVLGDTFHMLCSAEPWQAMAYAGDKLMHVHISHELEDLSGRIYPSEGDGSDYAGAIAVLKACGYKGDVSIEAGTQDLAHDGALAIKCLRPLMD